MKIENATGEIQFETDEGMIEVETEIEIEIDEEPMMEGLKIEIGFNLD